ncbi:MAG TPA: hypothetical protein VGJ84_09295, partial [Polyangiaceae bacterium]
MSEAPTFRVESLPGERVQVARAESAKHTGNAGHRLPLEHRQAMVIVRMLPCEIYRKLGVREHRPLAIVFRHLWNLNTGNGVLGNKLVSPKGSEHRVHRPANVPDCLTTLAGMASSFQHRAHMHRADTIDGHFAKTRQYMQPVTHPFVRGICEALV